MIKVYSTSWCPGCIKVKKYLEKRGFEYETINVADKHEDREEVFRASGQRTVPVIDINGNIIVGFEKKEIDKVLDNL